MGSLQPALFAVREMPNESVGQSPFEILYGSNPRGIMAIYSDLAVDKKLSQDIQDVYSYTVELRERIVKSGL